MEEGRLLLAHPVLSAHAATNLANVVHNKGFNDSFGSLLQTFVIVARQHNVQVQVTIADMTVTIRQDQVLLSRGELTAVSN